MQNISCVGEDAHIQPKRLSVSGRGKALHPMMNINAYNLFKVTAFFMCFFGIREGLSTQIP